MTRLIGIMLLLGGTTQATAQVSPPSPESATPEPATADEESTQNPIDPSGVPAIEVPSTVPAIEVPSAVPAGDNRGLTVVEAGSDPAVTSTSASVPKLKWSGYVDVGLFDVQGKGAGHVLDVGHIIFPQYQDVAWVFHGDPLATAINSRGDPADLGDANSASRAITFDSVNAGGNPSFLVNEINLELMAAPHPRVWLLVSADFLPRGRNVSNSEGVFLGDFMEIDLAFANWTAFSNDSHVLDLQVGKFDSVMGIEYRIQESPDRFGITPSLIFRYLGGHPVGIKARAQLWDQAINVAFAVTNGSHFIELFPFFDEQDQNAFKTLAGRIAARHQGEFTIEIGASGLFGAQDQQPDSSTMQWQVGADLTLEWGDLELRAEFVRGKAPGRTEAVPCDLAPCLRFQGAYGQLAYRLTNWLGVMTRVDWRDADHRSGQDFLYIVDALRVTGGVRFEIDNFAVVKAEYVHSRELKGRPNIANDVVTTSLVLKY